jgi:hypothetical protein
MRSVVKFVVVTTELPALPGASRSMVGVVIAFSLGLRLKISEKPLLAA